MQDRIDNLRFRLLIQERFMRELRVGVGSLRQQTGDRDPLMRDLQDRIGKVETTLYNCRMILSR